MSAAADRIRAMRDKGTITSEQADELLRALEEDQGGKGEAEGAGAEAKGTGTGPGPGSTGDAEDWADARRRHHARRRSGFLDMEWVGDMVDGITSGLGAGAAAWSGGEWKGPADNYRYEWDHRWSRRRGGNAENSSRVEQPEGEQFEFQDNRAVFSKISGLHLVRAKVRDNAFSASTFRDADLVDSSVVDSSLAGASLHELHMDHSEMKDVVIAGSKVSRLDLSDRSGLKNVKFAGSSVSSLSLSADTWIEDTRVSGTTVSGCTLAGKSRLKDCRLNGCTANRLDLKAVSMSDNRLDGCTLADTVLEDTDVHGCVLRGVSLRQSRITASRLRDCRLDSAGFDELTVQGSELRNLFIRDSLDAAFPRRTERFSIQDSRLDDVHFVGCRLSGCTITGVKASGLRIRGRDLSGRTIERADQLENLSEA